MKSASALPHAGGPPIAVGTGARPKCSILRLLLILASPLVASASTTVPPGEVSGTWSVAGSPYVVQGDIEIPGGETLVIDPGVTVQFETDAGLSANGTLTAVGTTASPIRFTSAQVSPSPGDWDGLRIYSSTSSLAWIEINYAVDGLLISRSSPTVSDCTIRSNADDGIRVAANAFGCGGSRAAPTIARCLVELNLDDGVEFHGYGSGSTGCTVPKTGSVGGTLTDSTVRYNTGTGIVIRAIDGYNANGYANPEVLGCEIHDNGGDGILVTGDDPTGPTISGSDVYLNAQSGIVRESSLGTVTITNNELRENTGSGLRNSSFRTIVSGNWIYDNNSEGVVASQLRQFSENTLYGNVDYDFYYLDTIDQVAPLNDWGTTDPVVIDSHIWDRLDNPSLGRVVVSPATGLVVTPDAALDFYGQAGGPFYPQKATWTLWNTQAGAFEWEIAGGENWLSVTPSSGSLLALDGVPAVVETTAEAESLALGTHTATLGFLNTTTGDGDTQRTVRLSVMERHLAFADAYGEGVYSPATSVVVSPDGAHVVVASGDTLSVFVRDGASGALALLEQHEDGQGGVDGLRGASSITLSPEGENVYATGSYDNAIAVFDRNPATGALTFLEVHKDGFGGVDGLFYPVSVAVSPDGAHVYVASRFDNAVAVFARDASTGRLTFVEVQKDGVGGVVGLDHVESLAMSPDGTHVYAANDGVTYTYPAFLAVFARDPSTGTLTFLEVHEDGVDGVDGLRGDSRVALSPDGAHLYVTGAYDQSVAMFARDASAGTLTFRRVYENNVDGEGLNGAVGLAVSADGGYLYVASHHGDALSVFRRNAATGELLFVESHRDGVDGVDGLETAQAVAVSPDGIHVYVLSNLDMKMALFSRVSALVANLSIAKSDSTDPVAAGGAFDYTLSVTNTGPSVAWGVRVEDTLPAGVSMTDATGTGWTCGEDGGLVVCSRESLDVGTAPLLTLSVTAPLEGGAITNEALVGASSSDPDTDDNNASEQTVVTTADLAITKTDGVTTAIPGYDTLTYTIMATNTTGPSAVTGASVSDAFPTELTCTWVCTPSSGTSCTAGPVSGDISDVVDLPVGASATYTAICSIAASATGTLSNTATIVPPAGIGDPVPADNQATDNDTVLSVPVDLILMDDTVITTKVFVASNSITAGPDFSIVDPGDVTFRAGAVIILRDGFSVAESAKFKAEIDPSMRALPTRR